MLLLGVVAPASRGDGASVAEPETCTVRVPGTTVEFTMVRCPGGEDETGQDVPALWVLRTETPWELYDVYVYALDHPEESGADAVARPSKPYVPPDRGFGHEGYPAMGMTRTAAEGFCEWLSKSTGVAFRLPTGAEWTHLALGGADDASAGDSSIDAVAWHDANAEHTTHPVGGKAPNAFGLYDTLGNVSEWVTTDAKRPVAMGGSWRDAPGDCTPTHAQQQARDWNASDPQIPKSRWWLADCSWVGFRFVTQQNPGEKRP